VDRKWVFSTIYAALDRTKTMRGEQELCRSFGAMLAKAQQIFAFFRARAENNSKPGEYRF
jgi:hypothetical protein